MKAHTAGPWHIVSKHNEVPVLQSVDLNGSGDYVGEVRIYTPQDAALIASAPDLLAALEAMTKEINFLVEDGTLPQSALEHETMMKARAAIERAKQ